MNINYQSQSPNFGIKISPRVETQLYKQLNEIGEKRIPKKSFETQLENVKKWGSDDLELVVTRNIIGDYSLGLKKKIENLFPVSWSFERIGGKTELAQFLRLKEANIHKTENTIDWLYKKYGLDIFKSAINNEQSKFVKIKIKQ